MKLKFWRQSKVTSFLFILIVLLTSLVLTKEYHQVTNEEITSWTQDTSADCGVVLTGGAGRIKEGLALLLHGQIKKLIVSGVNPEVDFEDLFNDIIFWGTLNSKDILLERKSTTTYGNAQQSEAYLEAWHCRDIALITSKYHMQRAYKTFRASLPDKIKIFKHTLPAGRNESSILDIWTEVVKSLFYSVWAY